MKSLILLTFLTTSFIGFNQLSVSSGHSVQSYINQLLGEGVIILNASYTGSNEAIGIFDGSQTNIGIDNGVILTTGSAIDSANGPYGPNNTSSSGIDNGFSGFYLIDSIAGNTSYNAAFLEIDLIPTGDSLFLNYVFGSEEYPEYVCADFNDAFGFFLSGPNPGGGNYSNYNIPLVPGTSIPVSINTVNHGTAGSNGDITNCTSSGLSNSQYYMANDSGATIQYDGFTTPISAYAKVQCGETYKIFIAIADVADGVFDSGIFLKSNSLKSNGKLNLSIHENGVDSGSNIIVNNLNSPDSLYKDLYIVNNSTDSIGLTVSRNTLYNYPNWNDNICIDSICMNTNNSINWTQPNSTQLEIAPLDSVLFRPIVYSNQEKGCSIFQYFIKDSCSISQDTLKISWITENSPCSELGIKNQTQSTGVKLYPNPASDILKVEIKNYDYPVNFKINNISGELITKGTLNSTVSEIDLTELSSGTYFFNYTNSNELSSTLKFTVIK